MLSNKVNGVSSENIIFVILILFYIVFSYLIVPSVLKKHEAYVEHYEATKNANKLVFV